MTNNLRAVKLALLHGKTWRYLRYLHARRAMLMADGTRSVLVVGAGHGLAELALAMEFPHISFRLTDWGGATHDTSRAEAWSRAWGVLNISFSKLDILAPGEEVETCDMVYSVEVLEHIKDDATAASNMRKLANKYVFCLVPFAEEALNLREDMRARALEKFGHHLCGYNPERLLRLFPDPIAMCGTYWRHAGTKLRRAMGDMTASEIDASAESLMTQAEADLIDRIPTNTTEAQGIWWLSKA